MNRRSARITGLVAYPLDQGGTAIAPRGDCTVEIDNNVAVVRWGPTPEDGTTFSTVDWDRFENAGAFEYTD